MSFLAYITGFFMNFCRFCKLEKRGMKFKKNLLLGNYWANLNQTLLKWFLDGPLPKLCPVIPTSNWDGRQGRDGPWVVPFQNCVRQPRPSFKMAAVTKNRNFFKWPKLLYFKAVYCFERTCRVEFLQCKYLYVAPHIPNTYTEILHAWSTISNHSSKRVSICLYSWIHTGSWISTLLVKEWVVVLLPVVFRHIYMDFFI